MDCNPFAKPDMNYQHFHRKIPKSNLSRDGMKILYDFICNQLLNLFGMILYVSYINLDV